MFIDQGRLSLGSKGISMDDSGGNLGDVNWNKVPNRVKKYLQKGTRLPPSERKELVRFIVDECIYDNKPYPRTSQLRIVAAKAVSKYPKSLLDVCDGDTVGTGYDSLLNQLVNRVDNISRPKSQVSLKVHVQLKDGKQFKRKLMDSYGCARWQPDGLPEGQTEATQKDIMEKLQDKFTKNENGDDVETDMMLTYATQRRHINSRDHLLSDTLVKWPYLFQEQFLILHCNYLLDFNIMEKMKMAYANKVPKLLRYFEDQPKEVVKEIELAKKKREDNTPEIIGLLTCLGAYFEEEIEQVILTMPTDQSYAWDQPRERIQEVQDS
ncbi:uncharacterized protein LOC117117211 isoform X2 [Anneissia japonica]|uniref:uncharacterized protein LOC117117211 isoform X2 n=1 Tax=Anneissia japonica TaxID=1529436 RepID=UPI0014257122|nr:uncharacterized protein LOC117117211 isoform X2 [Anneissia japonica]